MIERSEQSSIADFQSEGAGAIPRPSHQKMKITLRQASTDFDKRSSDNIIRSHHSYTPKTRRVGRYIDWLVLNHGEIVGTIGLMDTPALSCRARDRYVGWNDSQKARNMHKLVANYRFTLMPNAPKNSGSKTLSLLTKICRKAWFEKYCADLVLIETVVKRPRRGTIYEASGWRMIGLTAGGDATYHGLGFGNPEKGERGTPEVRKLTFSGSRLLIFIKPLTKDFRRRLKI